MTQGTHHAIDDPRNRDIRIYVNGELRPRAQAVISVFDSGFILGDGVWEGLRVHGGRIAFLGAHLDRLYEAAKALDLDVGMDRASLTAALYQTLAANAMTEGVHMRLMVTRGLKSTPYQDPRASIGPATVVIIPEYKLPRPELLTQGVRLFTVHVRRGERRAVHADIEVDRLGGLVQAIEVRAEEGDPAAMDPQALPDSIPQDEPRVEHRDHGLRAWPQITVHIDADVAVARVIGCVVGTLCHSLTCVSHRGIGF